MDKVTQQNAANAEESASASEQLSAQAQAMHEMVNELAAMVGGAKRLMSGRLRSGRRGQALSPSDRVYHDITVSKESKKPAVTKAKPVRTVAEQNIPFDDSGFEQFNA
jgi:methyl-accepting chemotaxis protein